MGDVPWRKAQPAAQRQPSSSRNTGKVAGSSWSHLQLGFFLLFLFFFEKKKNTNQTKPPPEEQKQRRNEHRSLVRRFNSASQRLARGHTSKSVEVGVFRCVWISQTIRILLLPPNPFYAKDPPLFFNQPWEQPWFFRSTEAREQTRLSPGLFPPLCFTEAFRASPSL